MQADRAGLPAARSVASRDVVRLQPSGQPKTMTRRHRVRARPLRSDDFPPGTPLQHFCAWNEKTRRRDRRYRIACDLYSLIAAFGDHSEGRAMALAHLTTGPVIRARGRGRMVVAAGPLRAGSRGQGGSARPGVAAAENTVDRLLAAVGSADLDAHAAVFAAFEELSRTIDLAALAGHRPRLKPAPDRPPPRRILVIRLSALGDIVQSLGPAAAIRRHHRGDHITLLTTSPFAGFAARLGYYDEVMIDPRPGRFDVTGWLALRRALRRARFDRVYDLQTSERSAAYALLFRPGPVPEWSGTAKGCSHPHANLDRDTQHTIDKQAEQLLMAGIHPTPLPALPTFADAMPPGLGASPFVLIVPGASPRHPAKRWPARRYGILAETLRGAGYSPVVIGTRGEEALGAAIREICPEAVDLVGRTDLAAVAALGQHAALTVGNDTGVTHLAAAAGCPVVVLFSSATDPAWCAPRGRLVRVLAVPDLADLGVESVVAEVASVLGLRQAAAGHEALCAAAGETGLPGTFA
jgi:ADP-heptose:LPS heptosyltransferase